MHSRKITVRASDRPTSMEKLDARIFSAPLWSSAPRRMENSTEPPMPIHVPNEDKSVIIGAQTPAPARDAPPITGIFPI